jgi:hypothetical protein
METARPAGPDDLTTVVRLLAEFVAEQREQRGGEVWAAQDGRALCDVETRRADIDDPARLTLVGAIDDVPIGVLLVGSSLLDAVVAWAGERGARGVDATVLPGNRGSKNFFEMHGLVARAIRVFRAVGEG